VNRLKAELGGRGRYLWVLDGVPPDLSLDAVQALSAPTENGHTLITTRGRKWLSLGTTVEVLPLDEDHSLALLTGSGPSRRGYGKARQLAEALGGHPLSNLAESI
jgi:hypothetical protein